MLSKKLQSCLSNDRQDRMFFLHGSEWDHAVAAAIVTVTVTGI